MIDLVNRLILASVLIGNLGGFMLTTSNAQEDLLGEKKAFQILTEVLFSCNAPPLSPLETQTTVVLCYSEHTLTYTWRRNSFSSHA